MNWLPLGMNRELMMTVKDLQFVTDAEGRKTGVFLPIDQYEAFQEWLEDMDVAEAARKSVNEPTRPFNELVSEMQAAYEIDV